MIVIMSYYYLFGCLIIICYVFYSRNEFDNRFLRYKKKKNYSHLNIIYLL